jgi:uncharacterized protein (DUF433 family)
VTPGIGFRDDDVRRRPWVIGTGLDVWEIAEMLDNAGSLEKLLRDYDFLTERHVPLALVYRDAYPDEIAAAIEENNRPLDELLDLYPFVEFHSARP